MTNNLNFVEPVGFVVRVSWPQGHGWKHDPARDGAGCSWCGAWAKVNRHNECVDCAGADYATLADALRSAAEYVEHESRLRSMPVVDVVADEAGRRVNVWEVIA